MSYVLQIWENPPDLPLPATVEEAQQRVDELAGSRPGPNPKFRRLAQQLMAGYPGMASVSGDMDEDGEDQALAHLPWHGETLDGQGNEALFNVGLTTALLDRERPFAIAAATALGLCVLDGQAGQVFLPGGGSLPALPGPPPRKPYSPRRDIYPDTSIRVLQVWEQPASLPLPDSIQDIVALVDRLRDSHPGQNPKFLILARRLAALFPADGPTEGRPWGQAAPDGRTERAVYDIQVNSGVSEETLLRILRPAATLGLHVLDESRGQAHLAAGKTDQTRRLAPPLSPLSPRDQLHLFAARGNPRAQHFLAASYSRGMDPDPEAAMKWCRLAADQGVPEAQNDLGLHYINDLGDIAGGIRLLRAAADQGYAPAQANLGTRFFHGRGVARNHRDAARWYLRAAAQGNASAQSNLGVMYRNGLGVEQDHGKAADLFRQAAAQGDAAAQLNLGIAYYFGDGVVRRRVAARALFNLAVAGDRSLEKELEPPVLQDFTPLEKKEGEMLSRHMGQGGNPVAVLDAYLEQPPGPDPLRPQEAADRRNVQVALACLCTGLLLLGMVIASTPRPPFFALLQALGTFIGLAGLMALTRGIEGRGMARIIFGALLVVPLVNLATTLYLLKLAYQRLKAGI